MNALYRITYITWCALAGTLAHNYFQLTLFIFFNICVSIILTKKGLL